MGPGSQESGSKNANFSQGNCHQRKSTSRCPEFLGHGIRTLPLYPHQGLGIFYLPLQTQVRAAKVPGAAGERLLGCNSTKHPSCFLAKSDAACVNLLRLNRRLSGLNQSPKPRGDQGTNQYGYPFLEEAAGLHCGLEVILRCN